MGMYDDINVPKVDCIHCGEVIESGVPSEKTGKYSNWQSKDGPCEMRSLEYWEVDNFYTHCPHCGEWNEFNLSKPQYRPIEMYKHTGY